jgi:hypothetical protein
VAVTSSERNTKCRLTRIPPHKHCHGTETLRGCRAGWQPNILSGRGFRNFGERRSEWVNKRRPMDWWANSTAWLSFMPCWIPSSVFALPGWEYVQAGAAWNSAVATDRSPRLWLSVWLPRVTWSRATSTWHYLVGLQVPYLEVRRIDYPSGCNRRRFLRLRRSRAPCFTTSRLLN